MALVVFAVDQLSKSAINNSIAPAIEWRGRLLFGPGRHEHILGGLEFVDAHNRDLLGGYVPPPPLPLMVAVVLILIVWAARDLTRSPGDRPWLWSGLWVGGALGNLFELVQRGSVTDFIRLPIGHSSLVTNVADIAVVVGLVGLMLSDRKRVFKPIAILDDAQLITVPRATESITISGRVSPEHSGHSIHLERQNASGTGFDVVQTAVVDDKAAFTFTHRIRDLGTQVFRVAVPGGQDEPDVVGHSFTLRVA